MMLSAWVPPAHTGPQAGSLTGQLASSKTLTSGLLVKIMLKCHEVAGRCTKNVFDGKPTLPRPDRLKPYLRICTAE